MSRTDYARIAARYDENPIRHTNPPDPELAARTALGPVRLLDVACGTGNWLAVQVQSFGERLLAAGCDRSAEMLVRARTKIPEIAFTQAEAEQLPYPSAAFDAVSIRFAFHHFVDKDRALDEAARVLAPGGALLFANVAPESMRGNWVYRAFPETVALDGARFWPVSKLERALEARGFEVRLQLTITRAQLALAEVLAEVRRRDVSELALVSDARWAERLAELETELLREPTARWPNELALLNLVARRP